MERSAIPGFFYRLPGIPALVWAVLLASPQRIRDTRQLWAIRLEQSVCHASRHLRHMYDSPVVDANLN